MSENAAPSGVIDSLLVALGFQVDTAGIEELKQKTGELRKHAMEISAIFTAAAIGVGALVLKVARGMDDVGDAADIIGISAREFAALGKVADQNDSSLEAMKGTLQGIAQVTGEAALGVGRGAKIFDKLGLSAKDAEGNVRGATDVLDEVADRMAKMSSGERLAFASKLKIDPTLIPLLARGSAEFRRLRADALAANPLTEEQYKQADEIVKLWNKAVAATGSYIKVLAANLFPVFKRILSVYLEWTKATKSATSVVFIELVKLFAAAVETVFVWLVRVVRALSAAYTWMDQFGIVTKAAAVAMGLLVSYQVGGWLITVAKALKAATMAMTQFNLAAMLPIVAIGAIALAVGLLVDDFMTWKEGGDSVIGGLVEKFPELGDILNMIADGVEAVGQFLSDLWEQAKEPLGELLSSFMKLFKTVWPILKMIITGWAMLIAIALPYVIRFIAFVAEGWANLIAFLVDLVAGFVSTVAAIINAIADVFQSVVDTVSDIWGLFTDLLTGNFDGAIEHLKSLWSRFVGYFMSQFEFIQKAVQWVAEKLGFNDKTISINTSSSTNANGAAPASIASSGVLGNQSSSTNSSVTNTTTVGEIKIVTDDPKTAGKSVMDEIDRRNKAATRDGQSAVAL